MRSVAVLAAVLVLVPALEVAAREAPRHPIDTAEEACMERNESTAGMTNCAGQAYTAWDKELNKNYNALMKALPPKEREVLKAAQRRWLEYRDEEFRLIETVYSHAEGTMYITMRVEERAAVVKQRALKLGSHLELVQEGR